VPAGRDGAVRLEDFDLCAGLDAAKVQVLRSLLEPRRYAAGDVVIQRDGTRDRDLLPGCAARRAS